MNQSDAAPVLDISKLAVRRGTTLILDSINWRDYPVVQGTVLFITMVFVLINLAVDVLYAYLDPRIRYS